MKHIITFLFISILFFSCNEEGKKPRSLVELQNKKVSVTKSIDSLNLVLKNIEKNIEKLDDTKKLQSVTVVIPKNENFKHYIEIQGVVKADKNIEIRPELGGTVLKINVIEGQKVKNGQLLIHLDDSSIQNKITEINTQLLLAKTTFDRQKRLWDQKIGSEMQYLQAKAQLEGLENNKKTLYNQVSKMRITAPFSGIVDEIYPKKGELTNPQLPVIRLVNLDKVYIEADVTETYLPYIKVGNEALVLFPSINKEINSKIDLIGNVINPNNRSFKTKINISNNDNSLKPNLLADIKIVDFEENGIIIPSSLIQKNKQGDNFVYTVSNKNSEYIVSKRIVEIREEYNENSLIKSGIHINDTLIKKGARIVKDGELVKINN